MLSKVYSRYIDDVYAVFPNSNSCSRFVSILISRHKDIKSNMKKPNKTLNFLNVEIGLNNVGLNTCVRRKPANIGFLLNFLLFVQQLGNPE